MLLVPLVVRYARRGWFAGRAKWRKAALICVPCLAVAAGFQAYYDYRITGNPFVLPYMVYERQYNPVPLFVWQPLRDIDHWDVPTMRDMYRNDVRDYEKRRSAGGFFPELAFKAHWIYADYIGYWAPSLLVPAAGLLLVVRRRRWVQAALAVTLGLCGIVLFSNATMAHYVAPAVALFVYLVVSGLRGIANVRYGRWIVGAMLAVYVGMFCMYFGKWRDRVGSYWPRERQTIEQALDERPGDHLVLVRYVPTFNPSWDWVWNSADIDAQRVVWAHDLGAERNRELLAYYPHRDVWLLTVRLGEKALVPYDAGSR
jgi:hypothetical protein